MARRRSKHAPRGSNNRSIIILIIGAALALGLTLYLRSRAAQLSLRATAAENSAPLQEKSAP